MKFAGVAGGAIRIVHAEIGGNVTSNMVAIANILKNLKLAGVVGDQ
jgi:hypothetical protein